MGYKLITTRNSPNYTPADKVPAVYGMARKILSGTNHHWDDPAKRPKFWPTVDWVCRQAGNTSAHVVGEARRIAVLIDYAHAAWANGNGYANATTISAEWNPRASRGDKRTAAEFWADLWMFYGRFGLHDHEDWTATACPGRYNKHHITRAADAFYAKKLKATQKTKKPILKKPAAPKPNAPRRPNAKGLFWIVEPGDTLASVSEHYYGTPKKWRKIARKNGIKNPRQLEVGQHLAIPGPLYWRVEVGDTLKDPAEHFGFPDWRTVARNAGITNPQTLRAGQLIRVY